MARRSKPTRIDNEELERYLDVEDDLTVVVRGHLCLESALNALLDWTLPPELSNLQGLRFPARVDLAIALDRIPIESREAWLRVNELRNTFAHDLDAVINEAFADSLVEALARRSTREQGLIYVSSKAHGSPRERVAWGIASLWVDAIDSLSRHQPSHSNR